MAKIILIESYNFKGYPTGGQSSFADNIVSSFGKDLAIVGITTNNKKDVGRWGKININGVEYDYFPAQYVKKYYNRKPFIPERLTWFLALRRYKKAISNYNCSNIFIQSPDTLLAISQWNQKNICFRLAGLTNSLLMSRYKWARVFSNAFEKLYISKLKHVNTVFATSSKLEIEAYSEKVKRFGFNRNIYQLPTRVDVNIFYPRNDKEKLRNKLSLSLTGKIIVTSGRLSEVKGWQLLSDSFNLFHKKYPDSIFIFIGNGQDKEKIENYALNLGLQDNVKLVGYQPKEQLSEYLNTADLYVMGSYFEGWPTSMIEALACGIPICTTNFGSAREIVHNNKIGYIANDRDPISFASLMNKALSIKFNKELHSSEIEKYSLRNLKQDILRAWSIT